MSLFAKLLHTIQSWRRRRGGPRTTQLSSVAVEYLDHRQLLAVAFTGNVPIDFPASMTPGVVVLPNNPAVTHPVIAPDLIPIVKVSGFDIAGIRATYTPADDTLSIGIEQPASGQPGRPGAVIAGDADNNGDAGSVNPDVLALRPAFRDFPDLGSSETMGAFLDLRNTGYADVVAGFAADDLRTPKPYQVAQAIVNTSIPPTTPDFGPPLPNNAGNIYLVNSPAHPNLEFTITNFSQLYQSVTGQPLTPASTFSIGAFGGSSNDVGIGEAFFPQQPVRLSDLTPSTPIPPPPPVCPPVSPPVLIIRTRIATSTRRTPRTSGSASSGPRGSTRPGSTRRRSGWAGRVRPATLTGESTATSSRMRPSSSTARTSGFLRASSTPKSPAAPSTARRSRLRPGSSTATIPSIRRVPSAGSRPTLPARSSAHHGRRARLRSPASPSPYVPRSRPSRLAPGMPRPGRS